MNRDGVYARVEKREDGCWDWHGATRKSGYHTAHVDGKHWTVHRYVYTDTYGEPPRFYDVHHKCRNTWCVNPEHLEAIDKYQHNGVEHAEIINTWRHKAYALAREATHCSRGHEFTEENTYWRNRASGKNRECLTCVRMRSQKDATVAKLRRVISDYAVVFAKAQRERNEALQNETETRLVAAVEQLEDALSNG